MPVAFERYTPEDRRIELTEETNAPPCCRFSSIIRTSDSRPRNCTSKRTFPTEASIRLWQDSNAPTRPSQGRLLGGRGRRQLAAASAAVLGVQAAHEAHSDDWYAQNYCQRCSPECILLFFVFDLDMSRDRIKKRQKTCPNCGESVLRNTDECPECGYDF